MTYDSLTNTREDSQSWHVAGPDEITLVSAVPVAPSLSGDPGITLPPPAAMARGSVAGIIPDDDRVGAVVGKYRILKPIAAGGMGMVYLGEHELLGCKVAVKFIKSSLCRDQHALKRFLAEAVAATHIDHPGVVDVIDYGTHDDHGAYFVMEYLDGEELADRLRATGFLVLRKAIAIASQCALTLAAAHEVGIVHRDIKPENIFLVRDPAMRDGERVKLFDFGVAKFTRATEGFNLTQTKLGALLGTPRYMSPEQCRGQNDIDHRSDIYALGCVLYEMVCGRAPFEGGISEVLMAHIADQPRRPRQLNPTIPVALEQLILTMLAKEPNARPASMAQVADGLAAIDLDDVCPSLSLPSPASLVGGRAVVAPTIVASADTDLARGLGKRAALAHTVALAHPPSRAPRTAVLPKADRDDGTAPTRRDTEVVNTARPSVAAPVLTGVLVVLALLYCLAVLTAALA